MTITSPLFGVDEFFSVFLKCPGATLLLVKRIPFKEATKDKDAGCNHFVSPPLSNYPASRVSFDLPR